jgi:hypothetical protein
MAVGGSIVMLYLKFYLLFMQLTVVTVLIGVFFYYGLYKPYIYFGRMDGIIALLGLPIMMTWATFRYDFGVATVFIVPYAIFAYILWIFIDKQRDNSLKKKDYRPFKGLIFSRSIDGRFPFIDPEEARSVLRKNNLLIEGFEFDIRGDNFIIPVHRRTEPFEALSNYIIPRIEFASKIYIEEHLFKPKSIAQFR